VTMNNTLLCNNHIDLLMKKLSKASYIFRNAKTCMSASSLKVIYYAFFHPIICYRIIFWGNSYWVLIWPHWRRVVAQILWPVPEAAVTVLRTPDDGCDGRPKHVEWFCSK
jgi:hypothetical protein